MEREIERDNDRGRSSKRSRRRSGSQSGSDRSRRSSRDRSDDSMMSESDTESGVERKRKEALASVKCKLWTSTFHQAALSSYSHLYSVDSASVRAPEVV